MDAGGGEFEGGFMANADLDEAASTRVRAPADEQPYGDNEDTTFCFASQFTPGANPFASRKNEPFVPYYSAEGSGEGLSSLMTFSWGRANPSQTPPKSASRKNEPFVGAQRS